MADKKLRTVAAFARRQKTKKRDEEALSALHEAIVDDLDNGVLQVELIRITGYSREHLRQIAKTIRKTRETRPDR